MRNSRGKPLRSKWLGAGVIAVAVTALLLATFNVTADDGTSSFFTEDFSSTAYKDATYTTAKWNTITQRVTLPSSSASFNTATLTQTMTYSLWGSSAVWNPANKRVYVFGGSDGANGPVDAILEFNPQTSEVTRVGTLPNDSYYGVSSRTWTSAVYCPTNGCIYVFGGYIDSSSFSQDIVKFNPATGAASNVAVLTGADGLGKYLAGAFWSTTDNCAYILGGSSDGYSGFTYIDEIERFTPDSDGVILDTTLPAGIYGAPAGYSPVPISGHNRGYLFGGNYKYLPSGTSGIFTKINRFIPETSTATLASPVFNPKRTRSSCAYDADDNCFYVFGGTYVSGSTYYLNNIVKFTPESALSNIATLPNALCDTSSVWDYENNCGYTFGGLGSSTYNTIVKTTKTATYATPKVVQSLSVVTGTTITQAVLNASQSVPAGTSIAYEMTANGTNWENVTAGTVHQFVYTGSDLRWRATLSTTNNNVTPIINQINIYYHQPSDPSNTVATAESASQINLHWLDNADNEQGFIVERKTEVYGTYEPIAYISTISPDTGAGIPVWFSDESLSPDTTYYYRVCAYNEAGNSNYSNEANIATWLSAPSNITASAVSVTQINLSWTDNSQTEEGFIIERRTLYESFAQFATVASDVTTYSDTNCDFGTNYYYRVKACKTNRHAEDSDETNAVTAFLTPQYISNLVGQYYPNDIYSADVRDQLQAKLLDAEGYFEDGNVISGTAKMSDFAGEVQTETGVHITEQAGAVLYQLGMAETQLTAVIRGDEGVNPAPPPFIPEGQTITLTGVVSPCWFGGTYQWYTDSDKVALTGTTTGNINVNDLVIPTIGVYGLSLSNNLNDVGIYFIVTSTPGTTVFTATSYSTVITTTFTLTEPITNTKWGKKGEMHGIENNASVTITGQAFTTTAGAMIYLNPASATYASQWKLGYVQNLIEQSIVATYEDYTLPITLISGTNLALLDAFKPNEPVIYQSEPFSSSNDTKQTPLFSDRPEIYGFPWVDPYNQSPLLQLTRSSKFIRWLVAYNEHTEPKTIVYLRWWLWDLSFTAQFDITKQVKTRTTSITGGVNLLDKGDGPGDWSSVQAPNKPPIITKPIANDQTIWDKDNWEER